MATGLSEIGVGRIIWDQAEGLSKGIAADEPGAIAKQRQLFDLAETGDEAAVRDLMRVYRSGREAMEATLRVVVEVPARAVVSAMISQAGAHGLVKELFIDEMHQRADRLEGPNPSEVESLLAERVAICWLDAFVDDFRDATRTDTAQSFNQAALHDRRRSSAKARYLAALKALAAVRRVDLTAIQIKVDAREQARVGAAIEFTPGQD